VENILPLLATVTTADAVGRALRDGRPSANVEEAS
jgi:hypothetical protein